MPDGSYERDALAWAEHQAALLRRLAAGERAAEAIDWTRVIEEIEDVGLSELRACRSLLVQALAHLLKIYLWPDSDAAAHWRGEAASFLAAARRSFTPSMRQRIVLAELYPPPPCCAWSPSPAKCGGGSGRPMEEAAWGVAE